MPAVKVHSTQSQRTNARRTKKNEQKIQDARTVYKSSLANPTHVDWPRIPANLQNLLLAQTVALLERAEVADYHLERQAASRTRRRRPPNEPIQEPLDFVAPPQSLRPRPDLLENTSIGINAVTKRLEAQSHFQREIQTMDAIIHISKPPLSLVFVCQADMQPPALVEHLPQLVASCNSAPATVRRNNEQTNLVRLVTFAQGSECILSKALGMRRASVLAFEVGAPGLEDLQVHAEEVPVLLFGAAFVKSHIKQLRTSAPDRKKDRKQ